MKEKQVAQFLAKIAEDNVPAGVDLWPAIRGKVRARDHPSWWTRLVPITRLGWASLAVALLLAVSTAAYAVAPVFDKLFKQESGLQAIELADLVQDLALSQTVEGVTVILERGYADGNRIVLGLTIQDSTDRRYEARRLMLTDGAGTVFPRKSGYGVSGQSDIYDVTLPPGEGAYLFTFDAATLTDTPDELDLRLALALEALVLPQAAADGSSEQIEEELLDLHAVPEPSPLAEMLEPMPQGNVIGPYVFDFTLPFVHGQAIELQQAVKAAEVVITLHRVVITPSETQATFCFRTPDASREWVVIPVGDGGDAFGALDNQSGASGIECHRVSYPGALAEGSDPRTLAVTELVGFDLQNERGQARIAGPWVFKVVP